MESPKKEKNNPNLHDDVEWPKDAENDRYVSQQRSCEKNSHAFSYTKRANEVKCDCGIGYLLSAGMEVKDGHIYLGDALVI